MDWVEADYVNDYCPRWHGQIEYRLKDRTRIDCLTETEAIEFDWCKKWAEGVGQSLYYAKMTGTNPVLALICTEKEQDRFLRRAKIAAPWIKVIIIRKVNSGHSHIVSK